LEEFNQRQDAAICGRSARPGDIRADRQEAEGVSRSHGPKDVSLWERLRRWLEQARVRCSEEESKQFQLNKLGDEIAFLAKALSGVNQSVGFSRNDPPYGNIMIYEETRTMNMLVLTLLHLTLLITFVRWLMITIHQHLMCWTLQNILRRFVWTYLSSSGNCKAI